MLSPIVVRKHYTYIDKEYVNDYNRTRLNVKPNYEL